MGFFSELAGAVIKTVTLPVAVVKDVVNVAIGEEPDETKNHVESIGKDISKGADKLADGEL